MGSSGSIVARWGTGVDTFAAGCAAKSTFRLTPVCRMRDRSQLSRFRGIDEGGVMRQRSHDHSDELEAFYATKLSALLSPDELRTLASLLAKAEATQSQAQVRSIEAARSSMPWHKRWSVAYRAAG